MEGANLDETIAIILGGANLIADSFSMAASNFLGLQIRVAPEGEREEIRQIFGLLFLRALSCC